MIDELKSIDYEPFWLSLKLSFITTFILFFVFGMFVRKMDLSSFINIGSINPFWSCTIITYFMFAIYIGRGYLSSPINLLAYSYALYCLNSLKK